MPYSGIRWLPVVPRRTHDLLPVSVNAFGKPRLRPLQWLLIEWPKDQAEPCKYILSTLPEDTRLTNLVNAAYLRWRIERDYQDLK